MVAWPGSLSGVLRLTGITDQRGKTKIRSEVDVGPALVRRRYRSAVRRISIPVVMTNAQKIAFDTFYITDLEEGTLSFTWSDPLDGSTKTMRFASEDAPSFTSKEGGTQSTWQASFELEILP